MARDYKNRTPVFGIPSIGAGEFISEAAEERQANIIENALIGAISPHSGGHGVYRIGTFTTAGDAGGFTVNLSPSGGTPAAQGFIRFTHFKITDTIQWILTGDGVHKLFVQKIDNEVASTPRFGEVIVDSTLSDTIPDDALLIAEATILGGVIILDTEPVDRLNISTIDDHLVENINPHTDVLVQDQMFISGLTAQNAEFTVLQVTDRLELSGLASFSEPVIIEQNLDINGNVYLSGLNNRIFGNLILSGSSFIQTLEASEIFVLSGIDIRAEARFFNNIKIKSGITIDGRDIGNDGLVLDDHVSGLSAFNNPHGVTAAQVSGIPHTGSAMGGPELLGNLNVLSGVAVDGVNLKTIRRLLQGENVDDLHTHTMSGIPTEFILATPEYDGAVFSGTGVFDVTAIYEPTIDNSLYKFSTPAPAGAQVMTLVKRTGIPATFREWTNSGIQITHGVDPIGNTDTYINIQVRDNVGSLFDFGQIRESKLTETSFDATVLNGGVFSPGEFFTTLINVSVDAAAGGSVDIGDLKFEYDTKFPK